MSSTLKVLGRCWLKATECPSRLLPLAVVLINLGLTFITEFRTLQNHPNSGDEYAYLVSAEIFSRGRLAVPSPPQPEFFDVVHVVNDGKFYGKYPPGWPLLLTAGILLKVPWLVNPVLGALTILVLYELARRHFSLKAANVLALLSLANPFLVFNSASYFSHTSCLLFVALGFLFLFNVTSRPGDLASWAALGLSVGVAFTIRPFTVVVLFALPGLYLLYITLRRRKELQPRLLGLALAAAPFALCLGLFLAYNKAQTGAYLLQPFQKYASWDAPSLPKSPQEWKIRFTSHVLERLWQLNLWMPLSVGFLLVALFLHDLRRDLKIGLQTISFLALFVAFFFYWGDGIIQYGPRYMYEAFGILALVSAVVVAGFGGSGVLCILGILIVSLSTLWHASALFEQEIRGKRDLYLCVQEAQLENAIVFLGTGSGSAPVWDCTRNGLDFNGSVLYVRDFGPRNSLLMRSLPDRKPYLYEFDQRKRKGQVIPYPLPSSDRSMPGSRQPP